MNSTAFLIMRLAIGASMFGHGITRLPKLAAFSHGMVAGFEKSVIPKFGVTLFSYILPFAEFVIGLLLIVGLWSHFAATAGGLLMVALIFGTSTIEKWENLPSLMIHSAFFAVLLNCIDCNSWALDNLF